MGFFIKFLVFCTVFVWAYPVASVSATSPVLLGVTRITSLQSFATADGTFENGWQWVFDITVPEKQTILNLKFADWINGSKVIPAALNMRFYSGQSINAQDKDHSIIIAEASAFSEAMNINPAVDLDISREGRQIQVFVEMAVPAGSGNGSYSTSYGMKSSVDPNAVIGEAVSAQTLVTTAVNTVEWNSDQDLFKANVANMVDVSSDTNVRYKIEIKKDGVPAAGLTLNYNTAEWAAFMGSSQGSFTTDANGIAYLDPVYGRLLSVGESSTLKSLAGLTTNFSANPLIPYGTYTMSFSVVKVNSDGSYSLLTNTQTKDFYAPKVITQLTRTFNGPLAGKVAKGTQDAVLYRFELKSSAGALDIRKLRFKVNDIASDSGTLLSLISDLKIKNVDTGSVVAGHVDAVIDEDEIVFSDSFTLPANHTMSLQITADINSAVDSSGREYVVTLNPMIDGDVRIVDYNENLSISKVIPNTAIVGNKIGTVVSSLTAALAETPTSGIFLTARSMLPVAGFNFTAGSDRDVSITKLVLQGSASTTRGFVYSDFNDVISTCGLYDGDTLIKSKNPTSAGLMTFDGLSITVVAGATKTLVVKCTTLTTVAYPTDFAVGITNISAIDQDLNEIPVSTVNSDNNLDTDGGVPLIKQAYLKQGSLTIATGSQPESTIILGETDTKLAEFRATAIDEAIRITKVHVTSTGDASSLTEVKIRVKGSDTVVGTAVLSSGNSQNATSTLTTPVVIEKDATKTIEVWATTGVVVKPDASSGAKSGNSILLAVKPNSFEAYGEASGEKLTVTSADVSGNTMVLRKSKPTITVQTIDSTLSSGSEKQLIKFQVSADAAGDIAWKKITFSISTTTHVTDLTSFKLYRGATDITSDSVSSTLSAYDSTTNDVYTLVLKDGKEEVVSGSGVQYTLAATPTLTSPVSGDSITTKIKAETATTVYTGPYVSYTDVLTDNVGGANAAHADFFLWSDLSDPGSPVVTNVDWTNGARVKDITVQSALVY
jgi:hypothetical protein